MRTFYDRFPWPALLILALTGGVLMTLAHSQLAWWPGLLLLPAVLVMIGLGSTVVQMLVGGVVVAAAGSLGLVSLAWEPVVGAALIGYRLVVLLLALAAIRHSRDRLPRWALALLYPSVLVTAEFAMTFSPLGTALGDAYLLDDALVLQQTAAVVGHYGPAFLVAWVGSVLGLVLWEPRSAAWRRTVSAVYVVLAAVLTFGFLHLREVPEETITVGAVHAPTSRGKPNTAVESAERIEAYAPLVRQAAERGAEIVVWPEMILSYEAAWADSLDGLLAEIARATGAWQVVGIYHRDPPRNLAHIIAPDGATRARYQKTHLVTAMERSEPGNEPAPIVEAAGARLGVMICNDDVFPDVARQLGRDGAQIIADPTWDWADVAPKHAQITRLRAIENRVAIIRGTQGGISQLIDPRGRIVAEHNVLEDPHQVLVGELPLGEGRSVYARIGDVFAWAVVVLLAGLLAFGRVRRLRAD